MSHKLIKQIETREMYIDTLKQAHRANLTAIELLQGCNRSIKEIINKLKKDNERINR